VAKNLFTIFFSCAIETSVPGSLVKKGGSRYHLLLNKRWLLLPPFLSDDPGTDLHQVTFFQMLKNKYQPILLTCKTSIVPFAAPRPPKTAS
jgi:hypothetical protein